MRVLVIEDDQDMLRLYEMALERRGHEAIIATGKKPCLDHLPVDLVIIDYQLPGRNGVQVLQELRAQQPELPAVFVSAVSGHLDMAEIESTGCPLIRKPFSFADLDAVIEQVQGGQ